METLESNDMVESNSSYQKNGKSNIDLHTSNDEDYTLELEKKLASKEKEILSIKEKLEDTEERLHHTIEDKKSLKNRINELELKELSIQLGNYEKLKMDHSKLDHRTQVTKKQLEDARKYIKFMENVIEDLENRGITDLLRRRFPETYIEYMKKK